MQQQISSQQISKRIWISTTTLWNSTDTKTPKAVSKLSTESAIIQLKIRVYWGECTMWFRNIELTRVEKSIRRKEYKTQRAPAANWDSTCTGALSSASKGTEVTEEMRFSISYSRKKRWRAQRNTQRAIKNDWSWLYRKESAAYSIVRRV